MTEQPEAVRTDSEQPGSVRPGSERPSSVRPVSQPSRSRPGSERPGAEPRQAVHPRLHSIPGGSGSIPGGSDSVPGGSEERRPARPAAPEPLWREVLGERLRALRLERGATLVETARRAGISPQYLSEVERGRKEPSSEMIAAVAGALGLTLVGLTIGIADDLRAHQRRTAPGRRTGGPATSCAAPALGRSAGASRLSLVG